MSSANSLAFSSRRWISRFMSMVADIFAAAEPEFRSWWAQQPVDMVQLILDDFEATLGHCSDFRCDAMMEFARAELQLYVRFHRRVTRWVDSIDRLPGKDDPEIHWRLRNPSDNEKRAGLEPVGDIVKRNLLQILKKGEESDCHIPGYMS